MSIGNNDLIQLASPMRIFLKQVFLKQCPGESGTQRGHRPQDQSDQQEWRWTARCRAEFFLVWLPNHIFHLWCFSSIGSHSTEGSNFPVHKQWLLPRIESSFFGHKHATKTHYKCLGPLFKVEIHLSLSRSNTLARDPILVSGNTFTQVLIVFSSQISNIG
jgi:hypothetical protein